MSCLFNSLSYFVPDDPPQLVRQKICNALALREEIMGIPVKLFMDLQSQTDPYRYISRMRQSSTWGGATEIHAFCDLYRVRVLCTSHRKKDQAKNHVIEYVPTQGVYNRTCRIYWTGGHYEPERSHAKRDNKVKKGT